MWKAIRASPPRAMARLSSAMTARSSSLEVHDRVEGDHAREALGRQVERPHVSHPELQLGIEPPCLLDHLRRQVDADHGHALLMQVSRDVAGAAAEVGHEAATAHLLGEPVEEMAIEGLA